MYTFRSFHRDSLRYYVLIFDVYLQFISSFLQDYSEINLNWINLHKFILTKTSLCSLSLRSACTIIVLFSNSLFISFPLSKVLISKECGPSFLISVILLADEVSLFFIELILTFLSSGASVTKYFWLISLIAWVLSNDLTSGIFFRSSP